MAAFVKLPTVEQEDALEIQRIVTNHLRDTGAYGIFPTPLHQIMDALSIQRDGDFAEFSERFIATLPPEEVAVGRRAMQKTRGMADLERRSLYLPPLQIVGQNTWRDGHELSHTILPWHQIIPRQIYSDDTRSLCQTARDRFECEANHGAKSFIFQPGIFDSEVNDSPLNFATILEMSERYNASIKATFFAAVASSRECHVGLTYLVNNYSRDGDGLPKLHKPMMVLSPSFENQHYDWQPPIEARTDWAQARLQNAPQSGEARITTSTQAFNFVWYSFWNQYGLMVLLRLKEEPVTFQLPIPVLKPSVRHESAVRVLNR